MKSSGPLFPLDPSSGAKFREFPKASEEGGHVRLLQSSGHGEGGKGVPLGSEPKNCGMDSEVTEPGEETDAQRRDATTTQEVS